MSTERKKTKHEGGVRKYLERTWLQRFRQCWCSRGVKTIGEGVFIDSNVKLLRHREKMTIGPHVILKEGARLCVTNPSALLDIGSMTTIGYHTFIFANNNISIGKDCLIAPFCYLVDSNHGFKKGELIRRQVMSSAPIIIEDDVWLGTGVKVLSGVTIGKGSVIAAGTVVREDVPCNAIVNGFPAKVVGYRD